MSISTSQHARQELNRKENFRVGVFWPVFVTIVGLMVVAIFLASTRFGSAKDFAVLIELEQIDLTLKRYHEKYGVYPPNADSPETTTHLKLRLKGQEIFQVAKIESLDENEVLLFWLGGIATRTFAKSNHDSPFYVVDEQRRRTLMAMAFPNTWLTKVVFLSFAMGRHFTKMLTREMFYPQRTFDKISREKSVIMIEFGFGDAAPQTALLVLI